MGQSFHEIDLTMHAHHYIFSLHCLKKKKKKSICRGTITPALMQTNIDYLLLVDWWGLMRFKAI